MRAYTRRPAARGRLVTEVDGATAVCCLQGLRDRTVWAAVTDTPQWQWRTVTRSPAAPARRNAGDEDAPTTALRLFRTLILVIRIHLVSVLEARHDDLERGGNVHLLVLHGTINERARLDEALRHASKTSSPTGFRQEIPGVSVAIGRADGILLFNLLLSAGLSGTSNHVPHMELRCPFLCLGPSAGSY